MKSSLPLFLAVFLLAKRPVAGECQFRGQEQFSVELPRIGAGCFGKTQKPNHG